MKILRLFVQANMRICAWLERTFPRAFAPKLGGATYLPDIKGLLQPIVARGGARILEVGGIDRPVLERDGTFVFAGLDIEHKERCDEVYDEFSVQSVEEPIAGEFDAIYSVTVLEHVPDNDASSRSMCAATAPGGWSIHYVPCRDHPYGLLLRLVGNSLQRRLLGLIAKGGRPMGGYPTYFDRCTPSAMKAAFVSAGYERVEIRPYYSPTPYFRAFVPVHLLVVLFMHVCEMARWERFSSGFLVVARQGGAVADASLQDDVA